MIGITIQCRMGNQLFQYFFINALAMQEHSGFFINDSFEAFILPEYFELKGYNKYRNKLNKLAFKLKVSGLFNKIQNVDIEKYEDFLALQHKDNISYGGYFQSASYFNNIKDKLGKLISVKAKHSREFNALCGHSFNTKKVVAVHIRRGDYKELNDWWKENLGSKDLTLPDAYYKAGLDKIRDIEDYQVIFISDDIAYVKNSFAYLKNAQFFSEAAIIDFQILMNADVCILSNSSFSWWGAYLNIKKARVICPEDWLGFKINKEYPQHIIPPGWEKIKVPQ